MKLNHISGLVGAFFLLNIHAGCKKFVKIDAPITQLVTTSVFSNDAAATAAQTAIYSNMQNESFNMSLSCGLLSDELTDFSNGRTNVQFYTNSMDPTNNSGPWSGAYNYIYQVNAIIEGLKNNTGVNSAVKAQLTGESKFIRAFWHFYLTSLYGDVPLVTGTDYTVNAALGRTSRSAVYQQVISDLQDAEGLLNADYIDASDTVSTPERVRPNKWAAAALLARVYLYTRDYPKAEEEATKVINNSLYHLCADPDSVFLSNSTEAIWQLAVPLPTGVNTADGVGFILVSAPGAVATPTAISTQLLNAFEPGDLRRTDWVGAYISTSSPTDTFYYPFKYKVQFSDVVTEYTMVLRLAEQYLIRAESRVENGNIPGGLEDLNSIRIRANLPGYAGSTNKSSVLAGILHERQTELFTEWGHRWFDLIRTENINVVMGAPGNICQSKGGTWSPNWVLFPIPQTERNKDSHLTQNYGYN